jgi:hypothetical protein
MKVIVFALLAAIALASVTGNVKPRRTAVAGAPTKPVIEAKDAPAKASVYLFTEREK